MYGITPPPPPDFVNPSQIPSIVFVPRFTVYFFSYTLPGIIAAI